MLVGDIGATKTILGIYSADSEARSPVMSETFPSDRYPDLYTLLDEFVKEKGVKVTRASFGVAGPVLDHRANITNLPWTIDEKRLREILKIENVDLFNDICAIANSIPCLKGEDLTTLNEGVPVECSPIAVIAPGTGLGEAFLTWEGGRDRGKYRPHASEGGHVDFAPKTKTEIDLLRHLYKDKDHVGYEDVCSGRGIPNIYNFLKGCGDFEEPAWLAEELKRADDPTPIIAGAALSTERACKICEETLSIFISVLAREAANLVLKVVANGGLYIGGGIPPRIISRIKDGAFMEAFVEKGVFRDFLSAVPVKVIMNPKAALIGTARYGLELFRE